MYVCEANNEEKCKMKRTNVCATSATTCCALGTTSIASLQGNSQVISPQKTWQLSNGEYRPSPTRFCLGCQVCFIPYHDYGILLCDAVLQCNAQRGKVTWDAEGNPLAPIEAWLKNRVDDAPLEDARQIKRKLVVTLWRWESSFPTNACSDCYKGAGIKNAIGKYCQCNSETASCGEAKIMLNMSYFTSRQKLHLKRAMPEK